jgi:hypothetical protein
MALLSSLKGQEANRYLLDVNNHDTITDAELAELNEAEQLNHFVMLLKAKARKT